MVALNLTTIGGRSILAIYRGTAFNVYYVLSAAAQLVLTVVMLMANNYSGIKRNDECIIRKYLYSDFTRYLTKMTLKSISIHVRHWLEIVHPSAFLLAAQLVLLLLYAAFDENLAGRAVISSFGVAVLLLVFWAVIRTPAANSAAWALAVPAFSLTALSAIFPSNLTLLGWSSLFEGLFYFYAAGSMIFYMLEDTTVTVDELFAAGTTFTLFAWGYAHLFLVAQAWSPGSFVGVNPGQPVTFLELLFLSFTNLSATGLGDIYPVSKMARVLLMLEQFTGVGYVAVVVSRLIGMTMLRLKTKRTE